MENSGLQTPPGNRVLDQLTGREDEPAPERRSGERRATSLPSLLYGGVRPRRRAGRRAGDHQEVLLDWHEPRVLYLALGILLMSCMDALFTLNILTGGGRELNGLMDRLIQFDQSWFVASKIAITGTAVVMLAVAVNRHLLGRVRVIRVLEFFCVGYAALIMWELYLLSVMFPRLTGTMAAAWTGIFP